MADYGKLLSRIWTDPDFTALPARAQQLYCLLISYSTRNYAGVLPMTLKRWAKCTSDSTTELIVDSLKALAAHDFIAVDWDSEEVLIRTYVRNDEVYKQPNIMKSALKSASHLESEPLRWVLHDELKRLPEHKDSDVTGRVIKDLVEGLKRQPKPGFEEGLREGFAEPPGVGVTYVTTDCTYTNHPSPTPTTEPPDVYDAEVVPAHVDNASRPQKRYASSSAKTLIRQELGTDYPRKTVDALAVEVDKLLAQGKPDTMIREAVRAWDRRPKAIPSWLEHVYGDVVKAHRATPLVSAADEKVNDWLNLANQQPTPHLKAIGE